MLTSLNLIKNQQSGIANNIKKKVANSCIVDLKNILAAIKAKKEKNMARCRKKYTSNLIISVGLTLKYPI